MLSLLVACTSGVCATKKLMSASLERETHNLWILYLKSYFFCDDGIQLDADNGERLKRAA